MLSSDRENNKDFDINNLFLNLDFQKQEETFEYKHPLLDHPSNYQCIVTKLLTRTSLPYIKLHESKKMKVSNIWPYEKFAYDYFIRGELEMGKGDHKDSLFFSTTKTLKRPNVDYHLYSGQRLLTIDADRNKYVRYVDSSNDYTIGKDKDENNIYVPRNQYWFSSAINRNVYSLKEIIQMIDDGMNEVVSHLLNLESWKDDTNYAETLNKIKETTPIFLNLEDNIPKLYILRELFDCLKTTAVFKNEIDRNGIKKVSRKMQIFIQRNLFKFLKGLPFTPLDGSDEEDCLLNITSANFTNLHTVTENYTVTEKNAEGKEIEVEKEKEFDWVIFTGEKINIMDVSDYIGLAITTPDFPVKEQNYPHFDFNFHNDFYIKNRRHYIPYSERNITGIYNLPLSENAQPYTFKKEYINDQINAYTGNKILFLKYFGKNDDLNCINYENIDGNTSLKMDLMNVMPLKKFTLRLFLIDRYNNLEPLYPKIEGHEDVIKLQLLFTRIKGDEKENRNIIETELKRPQKIIMNFNQNEEEEEEKEEEDEEMLPDGNNFIFIPYNPNEEVENELAPPAEKRIFINENDEDELPINEEVIGEEGNDNEVEQNNYLNNPEEEENNPESELY